MRTISAVVKVSLVMIKGKSVHKELCETKKKVAAFFFLMVRQRLFSRR